LENIIKEVKVKQFKVLFQTFLEGPEKNHEPMRMSGLRVDILTLDLLNTR
jgi:hypothetical protein